MNREDIERMEAGREMDDLIAVNVMGWEIGDRGAHYISLDGKERHYIIAGEFQPSTDIAAAWQVVEKMETLEYWFELSNVIPSSDEIVFEVNFQNSANSCYACEASAPLAICRAALLSVMEAKP